jgi:hypothetical protein
MANAPYTNCINDAQVDENILNKGETTSQFGIIHLDLILYVKNENDSI